MYHWVRISLLNISGSPLIGLSQQAIQIFTNEGGFFRNLLHGRKSSGGTKAASSQSRNREGNWVFNRRSHILLSSSWSIGQLCPTLILGGDKLFPNLWRSPPTPVSGNWTCRIYVFLWTFIFYMFFAISFYVSFTNLFSITLFSYLLITRDTQDEGEARFRFYWYRKQSKSNFMT